MKQLLIVLFIFSSSLFYGQDEKKEIRLGNREYREGTRVLSWSIEEHWRRVRSLL